MTPPEARHDVGGAVIAALLILLGVAMLWDTTQMLDRDSYVFPRAVIGAMMILCTVIIIRAMLVTRPPRERQEGASNARRIALVTAMLGGVAAMPWIGFWLAGIIIFGALMAIAMYDPWTRFRLVVYSLVGLALSLGFYFLFKRVFLVPFPEGVLFG